MPSQLTSLHPVLINAEQGAQKTVSNVGGTIYYKDSSSVSSSSNDGSVAGGASVTIAKPTWFISASESLITVADSSYLPGPLSESGTAAATDEVRLRVAGDTVDRLVINADGSMEWGSGSAALDTRIERIGVGKLVLGPGGLLNLNGVVGKMNVNPVNATDQAINVALSTDSTDDRFRVQGDGKLLWGDGTVTPLDTNLYRASANILRTDDAFDVNNASGLRILDGAGGVVGSVAGGGTTIALQTATLWGFDNADVATRTAGKGFQVKEGSNARMGIATLSGGTIVVNNTSVTANTRIILSRTTTGGTVGHLSTTRVNGTSFTINSSGAETSTVAWLLVEPAA